jgi:hypothetical protein
MVRLLNMDNTVAVITDKDRLDFIEAHPEMSLRKHKKHWSFVGFTNYEYSVFTDVRGAIDNAMRGVARGVK